MEQRKIKFRGKHIITGEWFYGYLLSENVIGKVEIIKTKPEIIERCIIDPETVGQYTGLKDNTKWDNLTAKEQLYWVSVDGNTDKNWNGKEIYEGDIVDYGVKTKMFVKYGDGMFEFWETETEKAFHWGIWNIHKELEVIGNIYSNPELLKK